MSSINVRAAWQPKGGGITAFVQAVVGGALVGAALGYVLSQLTRRIDDAQIEITLATILAYSSYLLGHYLNVSGVRRRSPPD